MDSLLGLGPFAWFGLSVLAYHGSELAVQAYFNPRLLSAESLLLSKHYLAAMGLAVLEYTLETLLFPETKAALLAYLFLPGLLMAVVGDVLRKAAQINAGAAFTHEIQVERRKEHKLVTEGLYAYVRHPGYGAWMMWAVGTQVLLGNIVSIGFFYYAAFAFFSSRIPYEEETLIDLFGDDYRKYRRRVWSGVPGVM